MNKILIIFAHPSKSGSKINKALRAAVEDLEGVTINDLYANYPDFYIDVEREQKLLIEHDVIIIQHPLYWYSTPTIVREWQDLVLQHGWAYGSAGNALKGKLFMQALTAGGDEQMFQREGANHFTIAELTTPLQAMANLCKMKWIPPFAVLGIHRGLPEEKVRTHAKNYRQMVCSLRDGTIDTEKACLEKYCNEHLERIIKGVN